jgi:hypothetical protein
MLDAELTLNLVDLALMISAAELLWLSWAGPVGRERLSRVAHLAAGLALMVALRLALTGAVGWPIAACLALSGLAHATARLSSRNSLSPRPHGAP